MGEQVPLWTTTYGPRARCCAWERGHTGWALLTWMPCCEDCKGHTQPSSGLLSEGYRGMARGTCSRTILRTLQIRYMTALPVWVLTKGSVLQM